MKRKKWSELEEQTLLTKYSDLLNSGTLPKLRTREKKFKPIADHVNSLHHLLDPVTFPFKWSWRDVSIKVQNMRHQYLGVKQKIRISNNDYDWNDGENHWENFLKYKEVFGDIELESRESSGNRRFTGDDYFGEEGIFGLGFGVDSEELEDEGEEQEEDAGMSHDDADDGSEEKEEVNNPGLEQKMKSRKKVVLGRQLLGLRNAAMRRERRMEREWKREEDWLDKEGERKEREFWRDIRYSEREEALEEREMELQERKMALARRECETRVRLEREFDEERRRRMKLEEKWEEEEMEWRERMVGMQIEHEKQMMQMQADVCQNQMQILGVMARLICQYFGSASDGLSGGLGTLTHQVLQNLQHPGGLSGGGKPDASSPSEFL